MKAKKTTKKLQLHKETLVNLGQEDQRNAVGGATRSCNTMCLSCITEVVQCETDSCYCTAIIAGCSTSIPTHC